MLIKISIMSHKRGFLDSRSHSRAKMPEERKAGFDTRPMRWSMQRNNAAPYSVNYFHSAF